MKAKDLLKAIRDISSRDRVPVLVKIPRTLHAEGKDLMDKLGITWAQLVSIGLMAAIEALEPEVDREQQDIARRDQASADKDDDFSPGQY